MTAQSRVSRIGHFDVAGARLELPPVDAVDVWMAWLDVAPDECERLEASLSEVERARRLRVAALPLRTRAVASRGFLREILGAYLGTPAAEVAIEEGNQGKPRLQRSDDDREPAPRLEFNVAHAGALALYAMCNNCAVGIDVEEVRPIADTLSIAAHFLAAEETRTLEALPEGERAAAFFRCWTRKEAYVKALGSGLARGLATFAVSVCGPPAILRGAEYAVNWTLVHLDPAPGFVGAVAVQRPSVSARFAPGPRPPCTEPLRGGTP